MTTATLKRVDVLLDASDRLWVSANWYTKQLNLLRRAWAEADGTDGAEAAEARYMRMSRRWKEESARLCAAADKLMAKEGA